MTIKYEIKRFGPDRIVAINCVKETDKTIWVESEWFGQNRIAQRRKTSDIHDTWIAAWAELIKRAQWDVDNAINRLSSAKRIFAECEALQDPTQGEHP